MSLVELLPSYIQALAILVAGVWTYWTFFRQRSNEPATDIDVSANFIGAQAGQVVVEVIAVLENKSLVRHKYGDFRINVRYLLPGDELVDSDARLLHQLRFPHSIDERIARQRRRFGNAEYINPHQSPPTLPTSLRDLHPLPRHVHPGPLQLRARNDTTGTFPRMAASAIAWPRSWRPST